MRDVIRSSAAAVAALLLLVAAGATRATPDAGALLDRVRERWDARTGLTARFEQTQRFAGFDEPLESKGTLRILRPNYFEISYEPPNRQIQVCDGTDVWTYTEATHQVIKTPLAPETGRAADLLEWTLADATPIGAIPDSSFGAGAIRLDLHPGPQLPLEDLRIWVRGETADLLGYEATDTDGNVTRMRLYDLRAAKGLKPADFRFRPPSGVEVIEMGSDGR